MSDFKHEGELANQLEHIKKELSDKSSRANVSIGIYKI